MAVAGVNYWAILVAAGAAWLLGAAYYMALARPWMAAQGWPDETAMLGPSGRMSPLPFLGSFIAELVMAWVLAGVMFHAGNGAFTIRTGVISAALVWLGFVATTIGVNHAFSKRPLRLFLIDAGHWLAVLVLMGVILGTWPP